MSGPALKHLGPTAGGCDVTGGSVGTLYTVPAATTTVVSKIVITNTTAGAVVVYVSVVPSGQSCTLANSIVYKVTIAADDYIEVGQGVTMATGDFICIQSDTTHVIFNAFGQENS